MKVAASPRIYMWRCSKVCDGGFLSYRQPSPRGEGAPKGRIGHRRYERGWKNASQAGDLRKHPSAAPRSPFPNGEGKSVAASPRSMTRSQLFWHSLSHIRRFSSLRMTKWGDAPLLFHKTIKGRPAQGLTLYLTFHLCYAIRNSEPLPIHDFQETRSFP